MLIKLKLQMYSKNFLQELVQSWYIRFQVLRKIFSTLEKNLEGSILQDKESKETFESLEPNKSPGFDDILTSVIKFISENILFLIKYIFDLSFQQEIDSNVLKVERGTPFFKKDEEYLLINYRPILVLPYFSKVLERIKCNRVSNYLSVKNLFCEKQFDFQAHSAEHTILQQISQVEKDKFTLGYYRFKKNIR